MQGINFTAIDFETATGKRASICEAGICVVRDGKTQETRSWLVRPQGNYYSYWNIQVHGIRSVDTRDAPEFPEVWGEIGRSGRTVLSLWRIMRLSIWVVSVIRLNFTVWRNRTLPIIARYVLPVSFMTLAAIR